MREIKFRAWDYGVMIYSDKYQDDNNYSEYDYLRFFFENIRGDSKLMQFTGLLDKNGKEIYEGDIVRSETYEINAMEVKWSYEHWEPFRYYMSRVEEDFEIIGNIFSTPELLEKH